MRLAKFLSSAGVASRRKSEDIIRMGLVAVNGEKIIDPATNVEESDEIKVNGKQVHVNTFVYYLLNKPTGVTSTTADEHAKQLITELVPANPPVWPVGRLDKNTEGLIILTNDGELTQKLTHPSFSKEKEYLLSVDRPLASYEISKLKKGITLEDGPFKPDLFEETSPGKYRIIIHEGRNRLIRRTIEHFDKAVVALKRVRIADVTLGRLASGKYRELTKQELERLRNA